MNSLLNKILESPGGKRNPDLIERAYKLACEFMDTITEDPFIDIDLQDYIKLPKKYKRNICCHGKSKCN